MSIRSYIAEVHMRKDWLLQAKVDGEYFDIQPLDAPEYIPAGASIWFDAPPLRGWAAQKMVPRHQPFF